MSKRLRDGVIFLQTSHLLMVNDEDSLKSSESEESLRRSDSEEEDSGQEPLATTNKHTESIAFVDNPRVRRNAAQHGTGQSPVTIPSFSADTYTEATVLSTRLTSCKPYVLRKRTCPKLTLPLSQLLLHCVLLSSFVLFMFLYCADIWCNT